MKTKANGGIAFKNKFKKDAKHPDFKGTVDVDGKQKEIAVWMREGAKGEYMTFSFSEPYNKSAEPPEGIYERKGIYDKPIDREQIQDDTPDDDTGLPF